MENKVTKRIQTVLRNMLVEFVRICDKHHLRYYPIDGTLLGAVRHKGFIPWDDDLDIAMPRSDYEVFCNVVNEELPENMYWVSYEESLDGNYFGEIAHLFCKDLRLVSEYFASGRTTDVWMDVMILYGMPRLPLIQKIHFIHYKFYKGLARMGRIQNIGCRNYSFFEKLMITLAQKIDFSKLLDTKKLLLHSIRILKKYDFDKAEYVLVVPSEYGIREVVPKSYYIGGTKGIFEDVFIMLPAKSSAILCQLYGNFMEYPEIDKQKSKHKVYVVEDCYDRQ